MAARHEREGGWYWGLENAHGSPDSLLALCADDEARRLVRRTGEPHVVYQGMRVRESTIHGPTRVRVRFVRREADPKPRGARLVGRHTPEVTS